MDKSIKSDTKRDNKSIHACHSFILTKHTFQNLEDNIFFFDSTSSIRHNTIFEPKYASTIRKDPPALQTHLVKKTLFISFNDLLAKPPLAIASQKKEKEKDHHSVKMFSFFFLDPSHGFNFEMLLYEARRVGRKEIQ